MSEQGACPFPHRASFACVNRESFLNQVAPSSRTCAPAPMRCGVSSPPSLCPVEAPGVRRAAGQGAREGSATATEA